MVHIDRRMTKYQESYYEKVVLTLFCLALCFVVRRCRKFYFQTDECRESLPC